MALPFAILLLPSVLLIPLCLYIISRRSKNPTTWPIFGILPSIIAANRRRRHSFHDFITSVLAATNLSFRTSGPPGSNMRLFWTCDPDNVRHIFTKNFANYPKGADFAAVFGVLEGTIFTADGEPWRRQRTRIHHVLTRPRLLASMSRGCRDKLAGGLVPLLSCMAIAGQAFDIEDVLGRLVLDMTVFLVFGEDPCCLSAGEMPAATAAMDVAVAMDALMEVAFMRHTVPKLCWKAMRRLRIGPEKRVAAAEAALWDFVAEKIKRRLATGRRRRRRTDGGGEEVTGGADILSHYIDDPDFFDGDGDAGEPTEFLVRTFINFMVALRDPVGAALPWLVYNLAAHPRVVSAVREELAPAVAAAASDGGAAAEMVVLAPEEVKGLVYLRAAVLESLRLFPPGPIERKAVVADDELPSGHRVHAGETVLVPVYSMGRMESVWGEDCREYRPERWLSGDDDVDGGRAAPAAGKQARLRFVPSYKFLSFNTGPRSCLGKGIAVAQMMAVAAAVSWNFDVEVVEGHAVEPKLSAVLQMKNGLMVKVKKRGDV